MPSSLSGHRDRVVANTTAHDFDISRLEEGRRIPDLGMRVGLGKGKIDEDEDESEMNVFPDRDQSPSTPPTLENLFSLTPLLIAHLKEVRTQIIIQQFCTFLTTSYFVANGPLMLTVRAQLKASMGAGTLPILELTKGNGWTVAAAEEKEMRRSLSKAWEKFKSVADTNGETTKEIAKAMGNQLKKLLAPKYEWNQRACDDWAPGPYPSPSSLIPASLEPIPPSKPPSLSSSEKASLISLPPSFHIHANRLFPELASSFTIADICSQGNASVSVRSTQAQPIVLEQLAQLAKSVIERCHEYALDLLEEQLRKEWMESVKWGDKEGWEWIVQCEEDPNEIRFLPGLDNENLTNLILRGSPTWPEVSQQWKESWEMLSQAKLKTFELVNEGDDHVIKNNPQAAIDTFTEAMKYDPSERPALLLKRASCYRSLQNWTEAEQDLNDLLALPPTTSHTPARSMLKKIRQKVKAISAASANGSAEPAQPPKSSAQVKLERKKKVKAAKRKASLVETDEKEKEVPNGSSAWNENGVRSPDEIQKDLPKSLPVEESVAVVVGTKTIATEEAEGAELKVEGKEDQKEKEKRDEKEVQPASQIEEIPAVALSTKMSSSTKSPLPHSSYEPIEVFTPSQPTTEFSGSQLPSQPRLNTASKAPDSALPPPASFSSTPNGKLSPSLLSSNLPPTSSPSGSVPSQPLASSVSSSVSNASSTTPFVPSSTTTTTTSNTTEYATTALTTPASPKPETFAPTTSFVAPLIQTIPAHHMHHSSVGGLPGSQSSFHQQPAQHSHQSQMNSIQHQQQQQFAPEEMYQRFNGSIPHYPSYVPSQPQFMVPPPLSHPHIQHIPQPQQQQQQQQQQLHSHHHHSNHHQQQQQPLPYQPFQHRFGPGGNNHIGTVHSSVSSKLDIREPPAVVTQAAAVTLPGSVRVPIVTEPIVKPSHESPKASIEQEVQNQEIQVEEQEEDKDSMEFGFDLLTGQKKVPKQNENGWWMPIEMEFEDGVVLMVCGEYLSKGACENDDCSFLHERGLPIFEEPYEDVYPEYESEQESAVSDILSDVEPEDDLPTTVTPPEIETRSSSSTVVAPTIESSSETVCNGKSSVALSSPSSSSPSPAGVKSLPDSNKSSSAVETKPKSFDKQQQPDDGIPKWYELDGEWANIEDWDEERRVVQTDEMNPSMVALAKLVLKPKEKLSAPVLAAMKGVMVKVSAITAGTEEEKKSERRGVVETALEKVEKMVALEKKESQVLAAKVAAEASSALPPSSQPPPSTVVHVPASDSASSDTAPSSSSTSIPAPMPTFASASASSTLSREDVSTKPKLATLAPIQASKSASTTSAAKATKTPVEKWWERGNNAAPLVTEENWATVPGKKKKK